MQGKRKAELVSVTLIGVNLAEKIATYGGGINMDEFTFAEITKFVVDVGITPALLITFIVFFLRRASDDDTRVKNAYTEAQQKIEDCNREVKERENVLMAESAKREEILRQEAERRENLIRKEAEKRESILMANQDRMLNSMDKITESLSKIELSLNNMEARHESDINRIKDQMDSLEHKIDRMGGR